MEGNLIIVESPEKAKTIGGFLDKKQYTIKASVGHIRDLQEKKLSVDLDHGFAPEYVVPAGKKKIVAELKKLSESASTVWLASDEDREGEAISWHLSETLGLDPAKTKRIAFHEITKTAVLDAIAHPREIDMNLVNAQQARRVLDRLVGFELSPILWRKIRPQLSAGRVQSVALRLIVDREKEIMAFESKPFYRVDALFHPAGTSAATKVKATLETRFDSAAEAEQFLLDSIDAVYSVANVDAKDGTRHPGAPFTTSTLQQEAARVLHFPVSTTMRVAQALYERGLITYMRTDSTNLSSLALGTAKKFIIEHFGAQYHQPRQYRTRSKGAQEAHEAIRPTVIERTAIQGTTQEQKLYNLIWKRTAASQMAEAKTLNTTIKVRSDRRSELFNIQATNIVFDGFLKVYMDNAGENENEGEGVILPEMKPGDRLEARSITAECKFSSAPARYSEGTLIKKLEELGIGRPSTYSPTITTLTSSRGYVVKGDKEGQKVPVTNFLLKDGAVTSLPKTEVVGAEKGRLLPQEIGMIVTDYLVKNFPGIMSYDFTANVEEDFDRIAAGELQWNQVIRDFYAPFHQKVDEALSDRQYSRISRVLGTAPDGEEIVAKFGQFGAYVQKGPAEKRQFASLDRGQLIESITLEEALKLFQLPRTAGRYEGVDIVLHRGRFGPYLKYGDKNISLPKGSNPMSITEEECIRLIVQEQNRTPMNAVLTEFADSGISIMNGRYGPYLKHDGRNYRIPRGKDAATLTEEECKAIVSGTQPTTRTRHRGPKKSS
ncbi:MAG: type I DNA topoisomerase [Bacteroidales bacterium]|nr:type I DNA topoisomerase [Bacteroidales bacterium]